MWIRFSSSGPNYFYLYSSFHFILMSFRILYVTATSVESDTLEKAKERLKSNEAGKEIELVSLVTGVGAIPTAWGLQKWISKNGKPDLAINAGIAGSFNSSIVKGDVVMPVRDCFADCGMEDGDEFITLFEAGLSEPDKFPFSNGQLFVENKYAEKIKNILKPVTAITVNTSTGSEISRNKLVKKFNPDIETMEGATFFYICSLENIPFLALRSISNVVEIRNKDNWEIKLALGNLSEKFVDVLLNLF